MHQRNGLTSYQPVLNNRWPAQDPVIADPLRFAPRARDAKPLGGSYRLRSGFADGFPIVSFLLSSTHAFSYRNALWHSISLYHNPSKGDSYVPKDLQTLANQTLDRS